MKAVLLAFATSFTISLFDPVFACPRVVCSPPTDAPMDIDGVGK